MAPTPSTPPAPRVTPRLPDLPEELVSNISIKLGSDDISAFRLTCRALEQKSFHEFATEYFKEKGFLITSDSLKALVGIASSEKLRGHLHSITILPALFSDRAFNCCSGDGCAWKRCVRQTEEWHRYVKDQKRIKRTEEDLAMLKEAFNNLPALSQLKFVDDPNPISSTVDVRDLTRSIRLANRKPTHFPDRPGDREFYRWRNHVWDVVMRALAASNISTLVGFGTELDQVRNSLSVSTNLWFPKHTRKGLGKALSNVHTVRLNISSRKQSHMDLDEYDGIDEEQGANNIGTFAKLFPALAHLDLTFMFSPSSQRLCGRFLARINAKQLRSLKLAKTLLGSKILLSVLAEAVDLTEFSMTQISLRTGNWKTVLKQLQQLERLEKLQLRSLLEKFDNVTFLKPRPKTENDSGGSSHTHPPGMPHDESDLADFFDGYNSEEDFTSDDEDDMIDTESAIGEKDKVKSAVAKDGWNEGGVSLSNQDNTSDQFVPSKSDNKANNTNDHPEKNDTKDLLGPGPSCGHQISLETRAQVVHWLPVFIKEYRVGDDEEDALTAQEHSLMMLGGMVFGGGGATLLPPMTVPVGPAAPPAPAAQPAGNAGNAASTGAAGTGNSNSNSGGGWDDA